MFRRRREDRVDLVGRLYDAHGTSLYRYALMLLFDHAAAEDAVQQVFAAVLRGTATLDNEVHYLRRAVRNECYSALRRRRDAPSDLRPILEPVADDVPVDERIAVERALEMLPADQREVVHLHVYEGMTFKEIGDSLDESINTVASRYRYALAKLRSALGGESQR
jgi:RNA polymerase sigma-70 factor (ECF subfamily)